LFYNPPRESIIAGRSMRVGFTFSQ